MFLLELIMRVAISEIQSVFCCVIQYCFLSQLCEWRWVLSLFIRSGSWLWSDRSCGYLRSRLSSYRRSAAVWRSTVAEEDSSERAHPHVVPEVKWVPSARACTFTLSTRYLSTFWALHPLPPSDLQLTFNSLLSLSSYFNASVLLFW